MKSPLEPDLLWMWLQLTNQSGYSERWGRHFSVPWAIEKYSSLVHILIRDFLLFCALGLFVTAHFPRLMIKIMILHGADSRNRTQVPDLFNLSLSWLKLCERLLSRLKVKEQSGWKKVKRMLCACVISEMLPWPLTPSHSPFFTQRCSEAAHKTRI